MGNFEVIDFEDWFTDHGINFDARTQQEKERLLSAFATCQTQEEFLKQVKEILNNEADNPLKKDIQ